MGVIYTEEICQIIDDECIAIFDSNSPHIQPHPTVNELQCLSVVLSAPLRIVKVRKNGVLVALAICSLQHAQVNGLHLFTYELFGTNLHDYVRLFVVDNESLIYLIKVLGKDAKRCKADAVYLKNVLVPGLDNIFLKNVFTINETALFLADNDNFLWNSIISKKSLKRHWNKIRSLPNFRVVHKESTITQKDVEELAALHRERWRFEELPSAFEKIGRIDEYLSYVQNKVITYIFLDSEIVCMHYGMRYGNTLLWHTPIINIKYLDYSPIEILLTATAQFCQSNNIKTLDFGLGDESYKNRFVNAKRFSYEKLLPITPKGYFAHILRSTGINKHAKEGINYLLQKALYAKRQFFALTSSVIWFEAIGIQVPAKNECSIKCVLIDSYMSFVDFCREKRIHIYRYQYKRFKDGAVFAALCNYQGVLSYGWVNQCSTFKIGEIQRELNFTEARLLYDFVTPLEFRNKGNYTTLLINLLRSFPGERLAIYSLKTNIPSIAAIKKAGFIEISSHKGSLC